MSEEDFGTLIEKFTAALSAPKESKLTIGGATILTMFSGIIAFLVIGYFTNNAEIGKLKLQDEYFRQTITEVKGTMVKVEALLTDIRTDQIRREKKER